MQASAKAGRQAQAFACQTGRWIRRNAAKINPPDKPDRDRPTNRRASEACFPVSGEKGLSLTPLILIPFHISSSYSPFSESGNYPVPVGEGRGGLIK